MLLGIWGDGQLALLLVEAAKKLNKEVLVLGSDEESPVARIYPEIYLKQKNAEEMERFFKKIKVLLIENEWIPIDVIEKYQSQYGFQMMPSLESFKLLSSKALQAEFFFKQGLNAPKTEVIREHEGMSDLNLDFDLNESDFPFVLKKSKNGYDGLGVKVVHSEVELLKAFKDFENKECVLQSKVKLKQELAQVIYISPSKQGIIFPLVETFQQNGICLWATTNLEGVSAEAKAGVEHIVERFFDSGIVGLFAIEFFVDTNDQVLINEVSPRVHNSGHITMHASNQSQFEVQILGAADFLSSEVDKNLNLSNNLNISNNRHTKREIQKLTTKNAIMVNLLGKKNREANNYFLDIEKCLSSINFLPGITVHVVSYEKKMERPKRKMGHVNLVVDDGVLISREMLKKYAEQIIAIEF